MAVSQTLELFFRRYSNLIVFHFFKYDHSFVTNVFLWKPSSLKDQAKYLLKILG